MKSIILSVRTTKLVVTVFFLLFCSQIHPQQSSDLSKKLDSLRIPDDKVIPFIGKEQLYVVNTRYSSLLRRHEITLKGGNNFTSKNHLQNRDVALTYRFHISDRWSLGLRTTTYFNKLNSSGEALLRDKKILPDTDFAKNAQEIFVNYNTIYGKLRWSTDSVVYFDQYVALGGGQINLASGKEIIGSIDLGFAAWIGNNTSFRIGIKNEGHYQNLIREGRSFQYKSIGYLEIGYLFGKGDRG